MILLTIFLVIVSLRIYKYYQRGPQRKYQIDLKDHVIVITGCSSGIGKESARTLAQGNATVVFACRDRVKTEPIIKEICEQTRNPNLTFMELNLADFDSVRCFAKNFHTRFNRLDILLNNAGIVSPYVVLNKEGVEQQMQTNHLGHFLLTNLLIDLIISTPRSRVINVSSMEHRYVKSSINFEDAYTGKYNTVLGAYQITKYCNVLFTQELQERFQRKGINSKAIAVHPGVVQTEVPDKFFKGSVGKLLVRLVKPVLAQAFLSEQEGAQTQLYTALQPYDELQPGGFYERCALSSCSGQVKKLGQHEELWRWSEKKVKYESLL